MTFIVIGCERNVAERVGRRRMARNASEYLPQVRLRGIGASARVNQPRQVPQLSVIERVVALLQVVESRFLAHLFLVPLLPRLERVLLPFVIERLGRLQCQGTEKVLGRCL